MSHTPNISIKKKTGDVVSVKHIGMLSMTDLVLILLRGSNSEYRQKLKQTRFARFLKKFLYVLFGIIAIPIWMYVFMISVKFLLGIS